MSKKANSLKNLQNDIETANICFVRVPEEGRKRALQKKKKIAGEKTMAEKSPNLAKFRTSRPEELGKSHTA